jgi:rubrerythrin
MLFGFFSAPYPRTRPWEKKINPAEPDWGEAMLDRQMDERVALAFAAKAASAERNRLYAALAKKERNRPRARLLEAIAMAEKTQASRLLMTLRGNVGPSDTYYGDLIRRSREVSAHVAPRIHKEMVEEENRYGAEFFERLARVTKNHLRLLEKSTGDPEDREHPLHVCRVCGFIARDNAPEKCPVCNAVPKKFTAIAP